MLTQHQREALDQYFELKDRYPKLFEERNSRPITLDRRALQSYAEKHGIVLGVAAETPYVLLLVDLVSTTRPDGSIFEFPYFRTIYRKQLEGATNAVVLGTIANPDLGPEGAIVLLGQERHATGSRHVELPRGFGEQGISGEENALKELREETGFVGRADSVTLLGETFTDTGLTDARVSFYHVEIVDRGSESTEAFEVKKSVELVSEKELWNRIRDGDMTDAFTIQAMTLWSTRDRRGGG
ncbi:ADP-ribose pyrophosphatase [Sinosporangium album]|uniref:ADP-ribose pyrophosphatase n=1 Tax=Sinosporangium album TaxID=504805 RepID=A0A1G7UWP3_9ACTN|nr:NUDIX hydrolase [Sinosporangium album]SDG51917.1 ADP-ribose pyrophosphatase [Sinosporangium album]